MSGDPSAGGPAPPPGPPPPSIDDYPPEYINANNSARIVGIVGFFHVLAFTFVALRIYVRLKLVRAFGVDDGLIIVAVLLALGSWVCLILQIPHGLGRHGIVIPFEDRVQFERLNFIKAVMSDGLAVGILRISMAISLLRLSRDTKWYRWSLSAIIVFVVCYTIQAIAWLFVYCDPYSGWWEFQWANPFDPRCHDFNLFLSLTYWNIACNIVTDVMLGALPVPIIWKLQMKLRVRIYVIAVLNLGYFAVLMGILKAVFMLTTGGDPDATFDLWVHFWQNLQVNIGIIAACASFLRPLVGRFLKISTSAMNYPSDSNKKSSTRPTLGTIGSNSYGPGRRGKGVHAIEDECDSDEFELHTRTGADPTSSKNNTGEEDDRQLRFQRSEEGLYSYGVTSDSRSDELIIQNPEPVRGIMMTRDVRVQYSEAR
ncbi:integral membrane protein [Sarocladium implicatum]|nr:integral membrane protein [Sarocladium implicatum]